MDNVTSWHQLKRGDAVQLRADGASLCHATIDDFSEDRRVVWVRMTELNERKLVLFDDGVGIMPIGCTYSQHANCI